LAKFLTILTSMVCSSLKNKLSINQFYHFMAADAHEKPEPKAAKII